MATFSLGPHTAKTEREGAHGVSPPLLVGTHAIMCLTLMTSSSSHYGPNAPSPNTITLGIRASTHAFGGDTIQYTVDKKWKIIKYVIKNCSRAGPWKSMMNGKGSEDQGAYCKGEVVKARWCDRILKWKRLSSNKTDGRWDDWIDFLIFNISHIGF